MNRRVQGPIRTAAIWGPYSKMTPSQQTLRRQLRQQRQSLSQPIQRQASSLIAQHLQHLLSYQRAHRVAIYWPTNGEVDLLPLTQDVSKAFFLPVLQERVRPWMGKGLLFRKFGHRLQPNCYGIPEPQSGKLLKAAQLDLILVPLVGFDRSGHRLGMGGGYYDRALFNVPAWRVIPKIGVGHSIQEVSAISPQAWDIKLDGVVTEAEFISTR